MFSPFIIPDTVDYMIAGYLVLTAALVIYLASLVSRWRKAAAEYERFQGDSPQE